MHPVSLRSSTCTTNNCEIKFWRKSRRDSRSLPRRGPAHTIITHHFSMIYMLAVGRLFVFVWRALATLKSYLAHVRGREQTRCVPKNQPRHYNFRILVTVRWRWREGVSTWNIQPVITFWIMISSATARTLSLW